MVALKLHYSALEEAVRAAHAVAVLVSFYRSHCLGRGCNVTNRLLDFLVLETRFINSFPIDFNTNARFSASAEAFALDLVVGAMIDVVSCALTDICPSTTLFAE